MIDVLTLLQEENRHLRQFREQTAEMVAVCDRMAQSKSRAELLHHRRDYRRLADKQDETNYRHKIRIRGISKRLNIEQHEPGKE